MINSQPNQQDNNTLEKLRQELSPIRADLEKIKKEELGIQKKIYEAESKIESLTQEIESLTQEIENSIQSISNQKTGFVDNLKLQHEKVELETKLEERKKQLKTLLSDSHSKKIKDWSDSLDKLRSGKLSQIENNVRILERKIKLKETERYQQQRLKDLETLDPYKSKLLKENADNKCRQEPDKHRANYITTNRFYVEIESELRASFTECSGLGVNIKKESYFEGGVNDQQRIFLGQAEFTDVTLKRGMTDDFTFWGWITQILSGLPGIRRNVNILLFNQAGETMQCWTLIGAIPISWKSPGLQADGNTVGIEELTLAYEGLQVKIKEGGGRAGVNLSRDGLGFFPSN